jgi:hypothetical protein
MTSLTTCRNVKKENIETYVKFNGDMGKFIIDKTQLFNNWKAESDKISDTTFNLGKTATTDAMMNILWGKKTEYENIQKPTIGKTFNTDCCDDKSYYYNKFTQKCIIPELYKQYSIMNELTTDKTPYKTKISKNVDICLNECTSDIQCKEILYDNTKDKCYFLGEDVPFEKYNFTQDKFFSIFKKNIYTDPITGKDKSITNPKSNTNTNTTSVAIGIVSAIVLMICIAVAIFVYKKRTATTATTATTMTNAVKI